MDRSPGEAIRIAAVSLRRGDSEAEEEYGRCVRTGTRDIGEVSYKEKNM